jgi:hypothetical protein
MAYGAMFTTVYGSATKKIQCPVDVSSQKEEYRPRSVELIKAIQMCYDYSCVIEY